MPNLPMGSSGENHGLLTDCFSANALQEIGGITILQNFGRLNKSEAMSYSAARILLVLVDAVPEICSSGSSMGGSGGGIPKLFNMSIASAVAVLETT
ncbi:MAG TPA: hypothetical protein VNW25_02985 [Candidatus Sulfotelmatobacter sp.]|nr:hypothetical protein [Candidatus Sulfotelmatobacter sp.]